MQKMCITQTFIATTFTFAKLLVSLPSDVEKLVTYTFCALLLLEYYTQDMFEYRGMQIETQIFLYN